jgi:hypothetical protein
MPAVREAQERMLGGLTAAERETFMQLVKKATDAGNSLSRAPLRGERETT